MFEGQRLRVKHHSHAGQAIQAVTHDRRPQAKRMRGVNPELVSAPCQRREPHARPSISPLIDTPVRHRRATEDRIEDLARPIIQIDTNR